METSPIKTYNLTVPQLQSRESFAQIAMAKILEVHCTRQTEERLTFLEALNIAETAYLIADAMLVAGRR